MMVVKLVGTFALVLGVVLVIFAGMAYFELHSAATSEKAPAADSMPLTRVVGPELFDPGKAGMQPAELAAMAFNRIYAIGGGGILLAVLGVVALAAPLARGTKPDA